jgi:hypothetical protein
MNIVPTAITTLHGVGRRLRSATYTIDDSVIPNTVSTESNAFIDLDMITLLDERLPSSEDPDSL